VAIRNYTRVAPWPREPVIVKHSVSSFVNTNLAEILKNKDLNDLVICGMQTNVCVKGTALDALLRLNYRVTVVGDAVAARSTEIHEKALQEMAAGKVTIVTTDELLGRLIGSPSF